MMFTDPSSPTQRATFVSGPPRRWIVEDTTTPPRAELLFVHGLCEHAYRFLEWAKRLSAAGIRVHLVHQLGHGVPEGMEESRFESLARAYFEGEASRVLAFVDTPSEELRAACAEARTANLRRLRTLRLTSTIDRVGETIDRLLADSELPVFIGGHSLGGLVAARVGASTEGLAGVAMLSPGLRPKGSPRGGALEQSLLDITWTAANSRYGRAFYRALQSVTCLPFSTDVQWASECISDLSIEPELHARDPLILDRVPLPFLGRLLDPILEALSSAEDYPCPVWLRAGGEDAVVDARGAEEFVYGLGDREQDDCAVWSDFAPHDPTRSSRAGEVTQGLIDFIGACLRRSPPTIR